MTYYEIRDEDLQDDGPGDLLPKGRYSAIVSRAIWKNASTGGRYIELELTIQGPTHARRKVWDRWNLENHNETTVARARRSAAALCMAIGLRGFHDPAELCDKMFEVNIGVEKNKDPRYPDKNNVVNYVKPIGAPLASPPTAQPGPKPGPPRVSAPRVAEDRGWQP